MTHRQGRVERRSRARHRRCGRLVEQRAVFEALKAGLKAIADGAHVVRVTRDVRLSRFCFVHRGFELVDGELRVFEPVGRRDHAAADEDLELRRAATEVEPRLVSHLVHAIADRDHLHEAGYRQRVVLHAERTGDVPVAAGLHDGSAGWIDAWTAHSAGGDGAHKPAVDAAHVAHGCEARIQT